MAEGMKNVLDAAINEHLLRLWYGSEGPFSRAPFDLLLQTGSLIYAKALQRDQEKLRARQKALPATVVSVGNLVAGGTGKTPLVLWLADHLQEIGRRPAILSRGYGRSSRQTSAVPATGELDQQAVFYGDEPVLMARKVEPVPVWVGRNRFYAGQAAINSAGADILLLDDGFQHLALKRDLDLVLLDAHNPFGNGSLLPFGPLREPIAHLERADAIVLTRADDPVRVSATFEMLRKRLPHKSIFSCRHRIAGFHAGWRHPPISTGVLKGRSCAAFAGIAGPDSFFRSVREFGIDLRLTIPFPDHHAYTSDDLIGVALAASGKGAEVLITTEKDYVRLPALFRQAVLYAGLQLDFGTDRDVFSSFLDGRLSRH